MVLWRSGADQHCRATCTEKRWEDDAEAEPQHGGQWWTVGAAGSSEGGVLELLDVRTVRLTSDLPEGMIRARWCHY